MKQSTPLRVRKAEQADIEVKLRSALAAARKAENARDLGPSKRKPNEFLARYVALPLDNEYAIRPAEAYVARSHNLARQVLGLVDHLFVRYPVPLFLYRTVLSWEGLYLIFGEGRGKERSPNSPTDVAGYLHWFMAAGRGDSFAKLTKSIFTNKEAHWFLQAPGHNRIDQNMFWAKAAAAGIPADGCGHLVERFGRADLHQLGNRLPDMLRFYAAVWPEIRKNDSHEITDFVLAVIGLPEFSFKGRTVGSMRKLSLDWHRYYFAGKICEFRSWPMQFPSWEHRKKGLIIRAVELTTNRALADEGSRQRHCVFGYEGRCIQGLSCIVSLRWFLPDTDNLLRTLPIERLTIEISPSRREIVQVRGRLNRRPTDEEMQVVRMWAGELGIRIRS